MFLFEIWFYFTLSLSSLFVSSRGRRHRPSIYLQYQLPPSHQNHPTQSQTHTQTKRNKTQIISKYVPVIHIMRDWKGIKNKLMKKSFSFPFYPDTQNTETNRREAHLWLFFIHSFIHTFKRAENSYNHQIIIVRFISL